MPIPLVNPEILPDSDWPFRAGQLVESPQGFFYIIEKCEWEEGVWWTRVYNDVADVEHDARAQYWRKPDPVAARSTFFLVRTS